MKTYRNIVAVALIACSAGLCSSAFAANVEAGFSPTGGAEALVLKTINNAQSSVRVMAYAFTSRSVVKALLDAKHRGVDVAVTVDFDNNVHKSKKKKKNTALTELSAAGIPVQVVKAFKIQHSKYIVVDEKVVETGSFNYSRAAAKSNSENVVVISDQPDFVGKYSRNWSEVTALGSPYHGSSADPDGYAAPSGDSNPGAHDGFDQASGDSEF